MLISFYAFNMSEKIDHRICIRFCQKVSETCKDTFEKLQRRYGEDCVSHTQVYEGFKHYKNERESVESDEQSGRPLTSKTDSNVELVYAGVRGNHQITFCELADDLNLSFRSVQSIRTDKLGMRHISAKFLPKALTADQKEARVSTCLLYTSRCV